MVATVRLDSKLENILNELAQNFHKKKSDIIRDAISFYAQSIEESKKTRMQNAISKTTNSDYKEYKDMEDTLNDGL
ncbi:MAG: CopG family transcriptional regulator [Campylobacterota bacterium]|nr:CopG family transcriptional regulator [Campylobacterota bacterium]